MTGSEARFNFAHLWRQAWLVFLVVLLAGLAALAVVLLRPPEYRSSARVLLQLRAPQEVSIETDADRVMGTQVEVAGSDAVVAAAAKELGMVARVLRPAIAVEVVPNTSVIWLSASGATSEQARARARALLQAFVDERQRVLAGTPGPGDVLLQSPQLPARPDKPKPLRDVGTAAGLGFVIGLAIASIRATTSERLLRAEDVRAATGVPVLAKLPYIAGVGFDLARSPSRLRPFVSRLEGVRSALELDGAQRVLVCTVSDHPEATGAATLLATATAGDHREAVLIRTHTSDSACGPTSRSLPEHPGLCQLVGEGVSVDDVACPPSRTGVANLWYIPAGRCEDPVSSLARLIHTDEWRKIFDRWQAVILAAPPVHATLLARDMQTVVLVVVLGQTLRKPVIEKLEMIKTAGVPVTGTIVVERGGMARFAGRGLLGKVMRSGTDPRPKVDDEARAL